MGLVWGPLEGLVLGVVHCADGACLIYLTDYTFHARSYHELN